nr:MAG TPA: hypothetical protein [Caudoviricetes sp.]
MDRFVNGLVKDRSPSNDPKMNCSCSSDNVCSVCEK